MSTAGDEQQRRPGPLLLMVDERVAFLIVGALNTGVGALAFWGFERLLLARLPDSYDYFVVLACAHVISVIVAFVLYRNLVFIVRGHVLRDFVRFESVYLGALGFNVVALPVLHKGLGMRPFYAQLVIVTVTVLWSWFGHKYFSFRRTESELAAQRGQGEP